MKTPTPEIENRAAAEAETASAVRPVPPAGAGVPKRYGWPSRLRSYFIFDPLIWMYTVVLGIISIPVSLFGEKGRILHGFARFWSQLIMKIDLLAHESDGAGQDRHFEGPTSTR